MVQSHQGLCLQGSFFMLSRAIPSLARLQIQVLYEGHSKYVSCHFCQFIKKNNVHLWHQVFFSFKVAENMVLSDAFKFQHLC